MKLTLENEFFIEYVDGNTPSGKKISIRANKDITKAVIVVDGILASPMIYFEDGRKIDFDSAQVKELIKQCVITLLEYSIASKEN